MILFIRKCKTFHGTNKTDPSGYDCFQYNEDGDVNKLKDEDKD